MEVEPLDKPKQMEPHRANRRRKPLLLRMAPPLWLGFFFLVAFWFWGMRPLWAPDEGRYAEAARGMMEYGSGFVPHLFARPHLTKPPVAYWAIAGGMELLGRNAWGARLLLAAAFFGTTLGVVALARSWGWDRRERYLAGCIFCTSALPFVAGNVLTTDMFLTFFVTLGLTAAWRVWAGTRHPFSWRAVFWLSFAIAFLTKGPPGWLALLGLLLFWWLRPSDSGGRLWSWPWFGIFLAVATSWYVALMIRDTSLIQFFLKDEVLDRVLTDDHDRENPPWIYSYVLLGGVFPWVFLWPSFFRKAIASWRSGWSGLSDPALFSSLWVGTSMIVFLISQSRMPLYVLPLFVPLAVWFGRLLPGSSLLRWASRSAGRRRWLGRAAMAWLLVLALSRMIPNWVQPERTHLRLTGQLHQWESERTEVPHYFARERQISALVPFDLNAEMFVLDVSWVDMTNWVAEHQEPGTRAVFIVEDEDTVKIPDFSENWEELAKDHKYAAIAVRAERFEALRRNP